MRVRPTADDALWNHPSVWSEEAEQAFIRARRRARRDVWAGRLFGHDWSLRSFDEACCRAVGSPIDVGLRNVPLARIVGSVNKAADFTSSFRPASDGLLGRWKRAYAVARGLRGFHPVDLYELDGEYYVLDGHFRVSVARSLGSDSILARVRSWTAGPALAAF
jgi:hypothetical protein